MLLQRAAGQATLTGDHGLVNALLTAALPLIGPDETATLAAVHTGRHAALYSLGRLEEADEQYRTIEGLCPAAVERADATAVQVRSLTHRNRLAEAVGLALELLRELGIAVPAADRFPAGLDRQFGYLYRWLDETDDAGDLSRPELTDLALLAAARLLEAIWRRPTRRRPRHVCLAGRGGAADLDGARPVPCPARRGGPRGLCRGGAARRLRRRVPGAAAAPGAGRGPRLRARHLAGALSVRSHCCWFEPVENGVQQLSGPGKGCSPAATWPTPSTATTRPRPACWTARHTGRFRRRGGGRAGLRAPDRQRAGRPAA